MHVEVGATLQQGIQIGRSVVILELGPQELKEKGQRHSEKEATEATSTRGLHSRKAIERR